MGNVSAEWAECLSTSAIHTHIQATDGVRVIHTHTHTHWGSKKGGKDTEKGWKNRRKGRKSDLKSTERGRERERVGASVSNAAATPTGVAISKQTAPL